VLGEEPRVEVGLIVGDSGALQACAGGGDARMD